MTESGAKKTADAELKDLRAEIAALKEALEEERARKAPPFSKEDVEELGDKLQDGLTDLEKQIDSNPVPSALIALGIGFLIGWFNVSKLL